MSPLCLFIQEFIPSPSTPQHPVLSLKEPIFPSSESSFPGNAVSMGGMAAPDGFNLGSRPLSFLLASHSREQWNSLCSNKHLQQERNPSFFPISPRSLPEKTPFSH